jgi:hypothetical protein
VDDIRRIRSGVRDIPPCKDCTEKFLACHDHCPKDIRGEHGYKAWKAELERVKENRKTYIEYLMPNKMNF